MDPEVASVVAALAEYDASDRDLRTRKGIPIPAIRQLLSVCGIELPVRFEHDAVPDDPATDDLSDFREVETDMWLVDDTNSRSRGGKPAKRGKVKVERIQRPGHEQWTCSCSYWRGARRTCKHIRRKKAELGISTEPYTTARRRPPTRWLYPEGTPTEETRRLNARKEWDWRTREMFVELLGIVVTEPARIVGPDRKPLGAIGMTLRAAAYCLFLKVREDKGYSALLEALRSDLDVLVRLGWRKEDPPSISTLCKHAANKSLVEPIASMLALTAEPGRYFEIGAMIDSEESPIAFVSNSRDLKADVLPAPYRCCVMIVCHHLTGNITGLIAAADITLDAGLGSADGPHLPRMARRAKTGPFPLLTMLIGDRAYGTKRNFGECEKIGIQLYADARSHEKRQNHRNKWPESARIVDKIEKEDPRAYKEVRRYRSKGEGVGSRRMRAKRRMALRPRKRQQPFEYPAEVKPYLEKSQPGAATGELIGKEKREANLAQGHRISDLPEPVIEQIMLAMERAVGPARLNELRMSNVVLNLRTLVTLEHLTGDGSRPDRVSFVTRKPLRVIPTVKEADLRATLARIAAEG